LARGEKACAISSVVKLQTSLSRQIRDLESELGVSLLHRGKGGITLTAAGNEYLAQARKLLADSAAAVQVTQAVAARNTGNC
jgi:LysR family hca operon transcriptional activator